MGKAFLIRHDPDTLLYARPAARPHRIEWFLTIFVAVVALALVVLARLAGVELPVPLEYSTVLA